jgi:short-subunit dehydrogenase
MQFAANASLYLGSKAAVEQFVRSLSREIGPRNITVNVLSPGFTDTEMLSDEHHRAYGAALSPFNRLGTPQDVAERDLRRNHELTNDNSATSQSTDEAAVRALYQQMMHGWNQGSGEAFAAVFAEDGDLIGFDGTHLKGRQEIARFH